MNRPSWLVVVAVTCSGATLVYADGLRAGALPGGDPRRGEALFQGRCTECHAPDMRVNSAGPALAGVYGRRAGSAPNYRYSPAMRGYGRVWSTPLLDRFLTNTSQAVPGTYMPVQIRSPQDRADLIAFLRSRSQ